MTMAIYLDGHASTPLAPEALHTMQVLWNSQVNSGSPHAAGAMAAAAVANARASIARLIGANSAEIIFTSGATEANNLAILGAAREVTKRTSRRRRLVVSSIEHKAVLAPAQVLEEDGFDVVLCPVTVDGRVDLDALERLVTHDTLLVSIMAANNEIGVIQPVAEAVKIAHRAGALVHCDAAQAAGKIPIDVFVLDVDYLSISAHKMYGPQGVGALFISAGAPVPTPIVHGGGQEGGIRAGTLPVALIGGFGAAAERAIVSMCADAAYGRALAGLFLQQLDERQVHYSHLCEAAERLPGSLALRLHGVEADSLVQMLSGSVSLTTGSACNSGQIGPSHVLTSIGQSSDAAAECIRLYFSPYNSDEDAVNAATHIAAACSKLRLATGEVHQ